MKRLSALLMALTVGVAQAELPSELDFDSYPWYPYKVHVTSKLQMEPIFVGGVDMVQTTPTYGNPAGEVPAKQWHDFIGFTPATESESGLGWVTVNHEMTEANDNIGDGGGMTAFKIDVDGGKIVVVPQTLEDGRSGEFFNVDFVNTVGETGMNCGGINSQNDGRIWTAEEWERTDNGLGYSGIGAYMRDTTDWTVSYGWEGTPYEGASFERFENNNYMVEIDPRQAKAIRKQYNWGRQWFEGGTILPDNRTVILGVDASPAFLSKFVADQPGDFTSGDLFVYKQQTNSFAGEWILMDNDAEGEDTFLNIEDQAKAAGATLFMRLEWVTFDKNSGLVYMTETGRDDAGNRFGRLLETASRPAKHHYDRAQAYGVDPTTVDYPDYYGRVLVLDPSANTVKPFVHGGPDFPDLGPAMEATVDNEGNLKIDDDDAEWQKAEYVPYPHKHLSNPDGLTVMYIKGKSYLLIQEDLNGVSHGRVHPGVVNRSCEFWIVDLDGRESAEVEELVRLGVVPVGAEVTGARPIYDPSDMDNAIALLINSQHPKAFNEAPYHNSVTVSITGWGDAITSIMEDGGLEDRALVKVYPNPTADVIGFEMVADAALYDADGRRIRIVRNASEMFVGDLSSGAYFLKFDKDPNLVKVMVQR